MSTKERPTDGVRVNVPDESSIVTTASGEPFLVEIENGDRVVYLPREDARALLNSGLPCSLPWKALNGELSQRLGPMPKPTAGVNVAKVQMAQWQAMRPTTVLEDVARLRAAVTGGWR